MPFISANGIRIYYEIHGEGEPLVLIPGLASDITEYAAMIREFAQSYQVIAFDNRGAGRTDKPDVPYSIDLMAADTACLIKALGIKPAHVLGISMGGRIAVALALGHPEHVKSLILVSTFVKRVPLGWLGHLLMTSMLWVPVLQSLGKQQRQPFSALARQRDASRNYDAADRLGEIAVPTLIIHGTTDHLAPFPLAEEMHAGIKGSKLIAYKGGHLVAFLNQKQFVSDVLSFVDSCR